MNRFIRGELMRKIAALLLLVLFINFLPLYPIAENPQPSVTVNGNQVEVNLDKEERATIVIKDDYGNRKYIDESDTGTFKTNLSRGGYTAEVLGYKPIEFTIDTDVKVEGNAVTIAGNIGKNTYITIVVEDSNGNRVYIDQGKSDKDGKYIFEFSLKESGEYTAYTTPKEGDTQEIRFTTTGEGEDIVDSEYILLPKNNSVENEYNTEFSIEFPDEITLKEPSDDIQLTLKGKKIEGTPEGVNQEEYTKEFKDVLVIDPKNPKRIAIDLSREGERLDVDYEYTVILNDKVVLKSDKLIDLSDLEWKFDTRWKDNTVLKEITPTDVMVKFNDHRDKLRALNGFVGLYAGQSFSLVHKASTNYKDVINYPLEWESLYPKVAEIDRNGAITGKSAGHAVFKVTIPQTKHIPNNKHKPRYISIEIKENFKKKLQLIDSYDLNATKMGVITDILVGNDDSVYFEDIIDSQWCVKRLKTSSNQRFSLDRDFAFELLPYEQLGELHCVEGQEYLRTSFNRIVDTSTGEILGKTMPRVKGKVLQYEEDKEIFVLQDQDEKEIILYDLMEEKNLWKHSYYGYAYEIDIHNGNIYIAHADRITCLNGNGNVIWTYDANKNNRADQVTSIYVSSSGEVFAILRGLFINSKPVLLALDSNGNMKYEIKDYEDISHALYEENDGGILFSVQELSDNKFEGETKLLKIDPKDGSLMDINEQKSLDFGIIVSPSDGTIENHPVILGEDNSGLYTDKFILDKNRTPIAYTDIPTDRDKSIKNSDIKNGFVYRVIETQSNYEHIIEKLKLIDEYTPITTDIDVDDEIIMYENSKKTILASLVDQYGFNIAGGLKFSIEEDSDALSVTSSGELVSKILKEEEFDEGKFSKKFTLNISTTDMKISKDVKVILKQTPKATAIYAVDRVVEDNTNITDYKILSHITIDTSGNRSHDINTFVADQHGDFIKLQDINYIPREDGLIRIVGYEGPSGKYDFKYIGKIYGDKEGKTIVDVSINNTYISTEVEVEVIDVSYEIMWQVETTGPWGSKTSYHDSGIYDDFIYTNENRVIALDNRTGSKLWESNVGVHYGMELTYPIVDKDGIVYVYNKRSTAVAAIDSGNQGEKLWGRFYGSEPIHQMDITDNYIYLMTDNGTLYKIDKDGNKIWDKKVSNENTKDMEVYADDIVYIVSGTDVYRIDGDGNKDKVYKANGKVDIRDISKDEDILLEVLRENSRYMAICIDRDGNEKWSKEVDAEFTAQWDDDRVYILSYRSRALTFKVYAFGSDGNSIFDTVEEKTRSINSSGIIKERKPVIKNNTIYTYIRETIAFDTDTGKFKWQAYIGDTYTPSPPRTLTVDDDGVVYSASGAGGQFAFIVGEKTATGFSVELNGRPSLSLDVLNNIFMTVRNKTEKNMEDVVLSAELHNLDRKKSTTAWAIKRGFDAGVSKDYSFGIDVPETGRYKLVIKAVQKDKVLDALELKVVEN